MLANIANVSKGDVVRFVEANPKWDLFESVKGWQKAELEINNLAPRNRDS